MPYISKKSTIAIICIRMDKDNEDGRCGGGETINTYCIITASQDQDFEKVFREKVKILVEESIKQQYIEKSRNAQYIKDLISDKDIQNYVTDIWELETVEIGNEVFEMINDTELTDLV